MCEFDYRFVRSKQPQYITLHLPQAKEQALVVFVLFVRVSDITNLIKPVSPPFTLQIFTSMLCTNCHFHFNGPVSFKLVDSKETEIIKNINHSHLLALHLCILTPTVKKQQLNF